MSTLIMHLQQFKAQRGRPRGDLPALIYRLGLEQSVLNQPWTQLSVRRLFRLTEHAWGWGTPGLYWTASRLHDAQP